MWFSYPGYNEILTGRADDQGIDSNARHLALIKLFWSNLQMSMAKEIAAFGSWDVFDIINQKRSRLYKLWFEPSTDYPLTHGEELLNELQRQFQAPGGQFGLTVYPSIC